MKTVTRDEFRTDSSKWVQHAQQEPVTVLDDEGRPCLRISGQYNELPSEDDVAALRARVAELEDTIRMARASDWLHSSYGRDEVANQMLTRIYAERGEDWAGAEVDNGPLGAWVPPWSKP